MADHPLYRAARAMRGIVMMGALVAPAMAPGATGQSERQFGVRAVVRTICRAELEATGTPVGDNEIELGRLHELCNNARGYRVTLIHSPTLAGSTLVLDSQNVVLSSSGETVVVQSSEPAFRDHQLALVFDGPRPANLNFNVRIDPQGMVW